MGLTEKLRERLKDRAREPGAPGPARPRPDGQPIKRAPVDARTRGQGKAKGKAPGKAQIAGADVDRRFLLAAAACAGLASLLAVTFLTQAGGRLAAAGSPVDVLVPSRDLPARTRLTPDLVTVAHVPRAYLPEHFLVDPKDAAGKITAVAIARNQVLTPSMVVNPGPATGVTPELADGERGFVLREVEGADLALVKPQDRIDLIATLPEPGSARLITATVVQDVRVLAVDGRYTPDATPPAQGGDSSLTLAVPAAKVDLLTVLRQQRHLQIALRGRDDTGRVHGTVRPEELEAMVLGEVPRPVAPEVADPHPHVVVVHDPVYHTIVAPRPRSHPHPHVTQDVEIINGRSH